VSIGRKESGSLLDTRKMVHIAIFGPVEQNPERTRIKNDSDNRLVGDSRTNIIISSPIFTIYEDF
jgi:hypothetical protein